MGHEISNKQKSKIKEIHYLLRLQNHKPEVRITHFFFLSLQHVCLGHVLRLLISYRGQSNLLGVTHKEADKHTTQCKGLVFAM